MSAKYLLVESRDPFESADVAFSYELAAGLVKAGHDVTMLLVQNGVLPARRTAKADGLAGVLKAGVKVLADDFSLAERGIDPARLAPGIAPAPIDVVVDHLAAGHKTLWH
jgi:sulfur relay (sulfurtransferase) complex TusBCD TusD component (DsrE family)